MSKLRILTARELEKILLSLGFKRMRQKGCHVFYKHADGRVTIIPHHKGKSLARPLLRSILRETKISLEDFNRCLDT